MIKILKYMIYWLLVTQLFVTNFVYAEDSTLDVAINIVVQNSEILSGKKELLNIADRKSSYSAKVRLGANYGQKQTLQTASGLDMQAGVGVEIPLFDDGGKSKDVAQAKIDFIAARDQLIAEFLKSVNELMMLERATRILLDDVTMTYEKFRYFKEGQRKAIVDAASLWANVEQVKKAEQARYLGEEKYKSMLLLVSKQYAPGQWVELQAAINQYIVNESPTKNTISSCQVSVDQSGSLGSCPAAVQ